MPQRAKVSRVWRLQPGDLLDRADAAADARLPSSEPASSSAVDVAGRRPGRKPMRPAGVSTSTSGSSQKRPREPVRTISIVDAAPRRGRGERRRDLVGADRHGAGIARDEDARRHRRASASSASSRVGVEPADHAARRPSPTGAVAQRPRQ